MTNISATTRIDVRRTPSRLAVVGIPVLVALAVRGIHYACWSVSPFSWYNFLPGLDMSTHMQWAEAFASSGTLINFYILLPGAARFLTSPQGAATLTVICQLALGAATAGLVSLICLWTLRSAWAALAAGCLFALYGPPLIYETAVLKESPNLFLHVLLLASVLWAAKKNFKPPQLALAGALMALPPLLRFSGVLWSALALAWLLWRWLSDTA